MTIIYAKNVDNRMAKLVRNVVGVRVFWDNRDKQLNVNIYIHCAQEHEVIYCLTLTLSFFKRFKQRKWVKLSIFLTSLAVMSKTTTVTKNKWLMSWSKLR